MLIGASCVSNLLKRPAPRTTVGMGPEIKTDFPQTLKKDKRPLKSFLVSSDCSQAKSLVLTWTITRLIEEGSESSSPGSLYRISGTVAPGKQRVTALKKQIFLMMESLVISVVRERKGRGRGGDGCGLHSRHSVVTSVVTRNKQTNISTRIVKSQGTLWGRRKVCVCSY